MNRVWNVTPSVLIPRESSSTVVQTALAYVKSLAADRNRGSSGDTSAAVTRVLDLGTGSGCLLGSFLLELLAVENIVPLGIGIDMYPAALDVARSNMCKHNLQDCSTLAQGTFLHPGDLVISQSPYDIVLCNPPYRTELLAKTKLDYNVKQYEPAAALIVQGNNSLIHYHEVSDLCKVLLRQGTGMVVFETPPDLSNGVQQILQQAGYQNVQVVRDKRGMDRCVCAIHSP